MSASDRFAFSLTTFSPTGKLVQIEHALKAVLNGRTSIGIKTRNGIVLAAERHLASPLIEEGAENRVVSIAPGIGLVYSGISPDARLLIEKARKIAQEHWLAFRAFPSALVMVKKLAAVIQEYTQSGLRSFLTKCSGVRPFGVSLLLVGVDEGSFSLYQIDPSGTFWQWKATAIGKNMADAKGFLERRYQEELTMEDAIHTAILAIKEGYEAGGAAGTTFSPSCVEIGILHMVPASKSAFCHLPEYQQQSPDAPMPEFSRLSDAEIAEYMLGAL